MTTTFVLNLGAAMLILTVVASVMHHAHRVSGHVLPVEESAAADEPERVAA